MSNQGCVLVQCNFITPLEKGKRKNLHSGVKCFENSALCLLLCHSAALCLVPVFLRKNHHLKLSVLIVVPIATG